MHLYIRSLIYLSVWLFIVIMLPLLLEYTCTVLGSCYDCEQSPYLKQYFIARPNEELTIENDP